MGIKITTYWKVQFFGWLLTSLYWSLGAFTEGGFIWSIGFVDLFLDITIGITITHLYRNYVLRKQWNKLHLNQLIPKILIAILILSFFYTVLIVGKLFLTSSSIEGHVQISFHEFLIAKAGIIFVTGIRLLSIWVLAYHLYHYSKREIERAKENAKLLLLAKDAQLNNLNAQLNPHFLFNALNTIKFLVIENPNFARRGIDLLGDLLRNTLSYEEQRKVSIQQEISLVQDYLELEKMRFEERLSIDIHLPKNLESHMILPLSIQTLVENAVKHGISKRQEKGFIHITIAALDKRIKIDVQNSGKLVIEPRNGVGLKNLKERLFLAYNAKALFTIKALNDEIVLASIILPII